MEINKNIIQQGEQPDVYVTVRLPKVVDRAVEIAALDMGSKQVVIEAALRDFLKIKEPRHA